MSQLDSPFNSGECPMFTQEEMARKMAELRTICRAISFNGDSLHASRRMGERNYWQSLIDKRKNEGMAIVRQLVPNYDGTFEAFVAANVHWLA